MSLTINIAFVIVYYKLVLLSLVVALSTLIPITALLYMEINILKYTLCLL